MENEQKTFIYILKVDASISPKSISVPHIFGALPTYGTFKVGPHPPAPTHLLHYKAAAKSVRVHHTTKNEASETVEAFRQLTRKNANSICKL